MMNKTLYDVFHNHSVTILGFGREGQSTYSYIRKIFPEKHIFIADKKEIKHHPLLSTDSACTVYSGNEYIQSIPETDIIVKTPGIAPKEIEMLKNKYKKTVWTSQTQLFLSIFRDRVIGITGTKGKSTTASLIHHIATTAGKRVVLAGNIGTPFFDVIDSDTPDTWYSAELSCHQLSDISVSPHIAVILNIYKEHLDYYDSFESYCAAKYNITRFQHSDDIFIYNADQKELIDLFSQSIAQQYPYSLTAATSKTAHINNLFEAVKTIPYQSVSNKNNIFAACIVSSCIGLNDKDILQGIQSFKPLPYRLETIGEYKGITFVDDALATIPEAAIAALNTCTKPVKTLLAGGYDRGQEYHELAKAIIEKEVTTIILFPTTGERLRKEIDFLDTKRHIQCYTVESMEQAVVLAYQHTPENSICLLSPAAPSFSLFKDYKDRSDQYRFFVSLYGKK